MAENIHDRFFKDNFSRQDIAVAFVRELFPADLVENLDLDGFALSNNSYIDPTLEEYFADLVYTCPYRGGGTVQVAILFEHKSYREKYPHFQLLRYMLNSWEQADKQAEPPVLLIPVLLYHGKTRWRYQSMQRYFGAVGAELLRFVPAFEYLLYDISHYDDERLLSFQNRFLATSLFLMKHRQHERELLANRQRLFFWLDELVDTEAGTNYIRTTVLYLTKTLDLTPDGFFHELFINTQTGKRAMSTYDQIIERGIREGRQEGRQEGREESFTNLLRVAYRQGVDIDLLASQYYDLPRETIDRIIAQIKQEPRA